ncbi:MAG: 6-phosphogluconolactonase [Thiomonas sp.]
MKNSDAPFEACADAADLAARLARDLAGVLRDALAARGSAVLAVSGGRSPVPLFHALAALPLDWTRITITLVDERFVPPDHADSNAALVRAHLLQGNAAAAHFAPLVGADDFAAVATPADAERALAAAVARANRGTRPIDVAVLGMGDDGHTASLFSGAPEIAAGLNPRNPMDWLAVHPPAAPHRRISLTLAALLRVGHLRLAISGATKRAVYAAALQARRDDLPLSALLHPPHAHFHVYWSP